MRTITKDEVVSRTFEFDDEKRQMTCKHTWKFKGDNETSYEMTTILDFTDVTPMLLYRLASRTALIKYQGLLRKMSQSDCGKEDGKVISVKALYETMRVAKSNAQRADDATAKLTAEEKAALIERLRADIES